MNKILLFPLIFLFMLSIIGNMFGTGLGTANAIDVPHSGNQWFDIGSPASILLMVTLAFTIGTIGGFTVVGTGFSTMSQKLLFIFAIFVGVWICLTITASAYLFSSLLFQTLYLILTFMYLVGVGLLASAGE